MAARNTFLRAALMGLIFQCAPAPILAQTMQDLLSRKAPPQRAAPAQAKTALFEDYKQQLIRILSSEARFPPARLTYPSASEFPPSKVVFPQVLAEFGLPPDCGKLLPFERVQSVLSSSVAATYMQDSDPMKAEAVSHIRRELQRLDEEMVNFSRSGLAGGECRPNAGADSVVRMVDAFLAFSKDAPQYAKEITDRDADASRARASAVAEAAASQKRAKEAVVARAKDKEAQDRARCISQFSISEEVTTKFIMLATNPWSICDLLVGSADSGVKASVAISGAAYRFNLSKGANRITFEARQSPDLHRHQVLIPVSYTVNGSTRRIQEARDVFNLEMNISAIGK